MRANILLVLTVLLAAGCTIGFPDAIKGVVSDRGAHASRTIRTPLGTYFTSASFVPGPIAPEHDWSQVSCGGGAFAGEVFHTAHTSRDVAGDACTAMLDAIRFMGFTGAVEVPVEYQLMIIPRGEGLEASATSLFPYTGLKLRFALPDSPRLRHDVVRTFAHEYLHMVMDLRDPRHRVIPEEEELAYMAGLCAQLEALGSLSWADLPGGPIEDSTEAIRRSSGQGYAVRQHAARYFTEGDTLQAASPAGREMLMECTTRLTGFVAAADAAGSIRP